ncbi:hypothetical protein L798_06640 [Zootermopsis nevadensis]|uniref:Uncharacterized protein n=1 Tax=Zootermopsis nevadensis TaxID=136037 RepID=A0A067R9Z8_ZOONE|nr:hypothetical protein L798_06640 [Zootermopsis nevadensis]
MLESWLLPQLNTNYDDYIIQLDGAHFHRLKGIATATVVIMGLDRKT